MLLTVLAVLAVALFAKEVLYQRMVWGVDYTPPSAGVVASPAAALAENAAAPASAGVAGIDHATHLYLCPMLRRMPFN
jgi:hypothetical protein